MPARRSNAAFEAALPRAEPLSKLAATLLQKFPRALQPSLSKVAAAPTTLLPIWPAVFALQQTVIIPHSAPAKPIMAVNLAPAGCSTFATGFTRQPNLISKNSSTANSSTGSQFSSCERVTNEVSVLIFSPARATRALALDRG